MEVIQKQSPLSARFHSPLGLKILATVALVFGIMTLFSGGNVLFGPQAAKELAGSYMPFVVWFNFVAGFFYIAAAVGIWMGRGWARPLALFIGVATGITALIFGWFVIQGDAYEMRTVGALALRTGFWVVVAKLVCRTWR